MKIFGFEKDDEKLMVHFLGLKITLKNDEKKRKINERIKNAQIIHVMFNDKFNKPFVDFLNKYFDTDKHLILCQRVSDCDSRPFPEGENVIEIEDIRDYDFKSQNIKKIICHSLFTPNLIKKLYKDREMLKKSYWVIWGGDLYGTQRDKQNDYVRKNFKGYITVATEDKKVVIDQYKPKSDIFLNIQYILPTSLSQLEEQNKVNNDFIKIQINNSACKTTLEMLDILEKFKNENIKISTILSYGDLKYKDEIIEKGQKIFGDKFEYLDKLISPKEYSKHLSEIDILILNQDRQQGLGNIFSALYFGSKIFIKSSISSYQFLEENFEIYDTYSIKNLSYNEFITNDYKNENKKSALMFFDEERIQTLWRKVFND